MDFELLKAQLSNAFPKVWIKDGDEFSRGHKNSLWTGEGSMITTTVPLPGEQFTFDIPAFDSCDLSDIYVFGVHHKLHKFLEERGFFAEFHDGGTVFIYRS